MIKGQAFLALIFLIGGVIVLIGVTIALLTNSFVDIGYGYRASIQASATVAAGAEDALLQLDRDSTISNTSGYSVAVASNTATVTITQSSPSSGFITIQSTATVSNRTKKVKVVLSANSTTGQTTISSWQEIQ